MTDSGHADVTTVCCYASTPFEAEAIVALLTAHGIRAYVAHRQLEDVFPTLFSREGTAVIVRRDELDDARALLAAEPAPGDAPAP